VTEFKWAEPLRCNISRSTASSGACLNQAKVHAAAVARLCRQFGMMPLFIFYRRMLRWGYAPILQRRALRGEHRDLKP
jgi:hypothetical protein